VNRWLFWSAHHFAPAVAVLGWENMVKGFVGAGAPDPIEVKRGETAVTLCAKILDGYLAGREWLCGNALTLADFAVAAPLMHIVPAKLPMTPYANIQSWFERVQSLAAWKKAASEK
jgi:glutathione S-transferase